MRPFTPCPKPEKPRRGDAECRAWMSLVAQLPCCICDAHPVELHHPIMGRFAQRKSSDFDVIPLCPRCHLSLHASPQAWRLRFGSDVGWIDRTREAVERLKARTV